MSRKLNGFGAALVLLAVIAAESESRFSGARGKRGELDPQTCAEDFDVQRDKIIRTEESREMGARYLSELDIGSREECLRLCCETDSCDVFVYEEKSPGSCYLFNCGPPEDFKCKFTRHTNFSSGVLAVSRHAAELRDRVRLSKHEHDLASLRNPAASTATTVKPTSPTTTTTTTTTTTKHSSPAQRRCSPYQFQCHGSGECIAIYNACDGIPQCADASDEAPELGCPNNTPPAPRSQPPQQTQRETQPADQLAAQKAYGAEAVSPFLREPSSEYGPAPSWPHRLVQAQPPFKQIEVNGLSSHIFNHKGSLLQEGESQPVQQYVPLESMQEAQWGRRPWQQSLPMEQVPMNERQVMYRYGDQGAWKQQELQAVRPDQLGSPAVRAGERTNAAGVPDTDKMWAVPRTSLKQELPIYSGQSMPEASLIYANQDGTLRDSPKKGINLSSKKEHPYANDPAFTIEDKDLSGQRNDGKVTSAHGVSEHAKNASDDSKTATSKHIEGSSAKTTDKENRHDIKHEHYKMQEDDHDGLSEKPAGAILLLIMGILMTTVMAVMLGCRLRLARRRMRRAGKSPFAHDADYLVNGMYL